MDVDGSIVTVAGIALATSAMTVEISYVVTEGSIFQVTLMLVSFNGEALTFVGFVGDTGESNHSKVQ